MVNVFIVFATSPVMTYLASNDFYYDFLFDTEADEIAHDLSLL